MPYWRLSGFYFLYFASLGALIPYWGLYLKESGYSAQDIGSLMALLMVTKIVSPNIWGWIADHTGRSMAIVKFGCLMAVISFTGVYLADGFWRLALVMIVFSFFWNATLPQFEVTTLNHLGNDSHRYSSIRLWGSIGFIVSVTGLGWLLEYFGAMYLPAMILLLFSGIWIASLVVPDLSGERPPQVQSSLRNVLLQPTVLALLVVCFLMQLSHGPYYTFYTIYLKQHEYAAGVIGQLWAVGVIAEVVVFLTMYKLGPMFGLRNLMLASLLLATLRWLLIAYFVESIIVMVFAQLLHAASFGMYHAVAIQMIHRLFVGKLQGRGQALYASFSFGAGGAVGSFYSGLLWDNLGSTMIYGIAASVSFVGFLVAWRWLAADAASQSEVPAKKSPG